LGGEKEAVTDLEPIFRTLAPGLGNIPRTPGMAEVGGTAEEGYLYCGPSGAGHFVKMLHNGIEYGLMQSYAEGFDILRNANSKELPEDCRYDLSMCSPLLCTRDSAHGKITPTPKRCFPPCD
jgi:6-phosphogluconate dehydrogenase